MNRPAVSLIYYHIPSDHDDESLPNAFPVPKSPGEVKLRDVKEKFPLPGQYHFRFKLKWNEGSTIWMDVTNEDSAVPSYNDKVICKVLRMSWQQTPISKSTPVRSGSGSSNSTQKGPGPSTNQINVTNGTTGSSGSSGKDLLFGGDSPKSSTRPIAKGNQDLLFDSFTSAPPPTKKQDDFDLF